MILNFGHTIGHALEAAAGYGTLLHGEAVAIGMAIECRIAMKMGLLNARAVKRINALLTRLKLVFRMRNIEINEIFRHIHADKKSSSESLRFALPVAIGKAEIIDDVPEKIVREVLRRYAT